MLKRTWNISTINWIVENPGHRPTHITVQLDDLELYPAVEQFANDERLKVIPSETGGRNERWIVYPHTDYKDAMKRLDERITNLYWERRWASESQYIIGDKVQIVEPLRSNPQQQPIFVQMYDQGVIAKVIGFDLYIVDFKNSGTISDVHTHNLRRVE